MSKAERRDWQGLDGRVAIVTGGGQGLGRHFALGLAEQGAIPVIAEINAERAEAVAEEIRAAGGKALAVATDVADYASVEAMAERTLEEFGRIDVLVNNAAVFSSLKKRPFDEIPLDEWDLVMRVNITGTYNCCRAVTPAMRKAGWGRIVNISSSTVETGRPNYLHYTTSKSAIVGMSRSLARELGKDGITVNTMMPGSTQTEVPRETVSPQQREAIVNSQCIPRHETPDDLLGGVLFLASDASRFVTGQILLVDGGLAHV